MVFLCHQKQNVGLGDISVLIEIFLRWGQSSGDSSRIFLHLLFKVRVTVALYFGRNVYNTKLNVAKPVLRHI